MLFVFSMIDPAFNQAGICATASYISAAPEELLTAVTGLIAGEKETRAELEAEPTVYMWIFYREGDDVCIRLFQLAGPGKHLEAGTEIWSSWQTADTLSKAIIEGFNEVVSKYEVADTTQSGGLPFPAPNSRRCAAPAWNAIPLDRRTGDISVPPHTRCREHVRFRRVQVGVDRDGAALAGGVDQAVESFPAHHPSQRS